MEEKTISQENVIDRQIGWDTFIEEQEGIRAIRSKKINPVKKATQVQELRNRLFPKLAIDGLSAEELARPF